MDEDLVLHYRSTSFDEDVNAVGIQDEEIARHISILKLNPKIGHALTSKNTLCYEWKVTMNCSVYYWHYILIDDINEIQSVALKRSGIDRDINTPLGGFLFGCRIVGAVIRELVKGFLTGV